MAKALGFPWIKVCGIRTPGDVEACARAGATHAGINTWPGSPRFVPSGEVPALLEVSLGLGLRPVLLLLPGSPIDPCDLLGLRPPFVQLLEPLPAALRHRLRKMGTLVVEARRATPENVSALPWGDVLLLDASTPGLLGGTGESVPMVLARRAPRPFVLAGGLGPGNVARAIREVSPAGVDAASGLESRTGVKDPGRIRAFCEAAREAFDGLRNQGVVRDGESASGEASYATSPCRSALQSATSFQKEPPCDSI